MTSATAIAQLHPARDRPVVVKIGGSAVAADPALWADLVRLHRRCSGLVLVHGGGDAVDAELRVRGMQPVKVEGLRVTPPQQMDVVVGVLAGRMNADICGRLVAAGLRDPAPVGMTIASGGLTRTVPLAGPGGVDLGRVGRAVAGDAAVAMAILHAGAACVLSSIGMDDAGASMNVNADHAAVAVAGAIGASELVFLSDVAGVLDGSGRAIDRLDRAGVEGLVASGVITGGMVPKACGAIEAAELTGVPTRIASWRGGAGPGTMFDPAATGPRSGQEAGWAGPGVPGRAGQDSGTPATGRGGR